MVRKIEKFAVTHMFANVMIALTIIITIIFGSVNIKKNGGGKLKTIYAFNPETWSAAIGFSVFSYEGIGTVLPISEVTKYPKDYKKLVILCVSVACIMFLIFGNFCCYAWGDSLTSPMITNNLIDGEPGTSEGEVVVFIVKVFFILNLVFSYPLILYPAIMIGENYMFSGWEKTKKR